MRKLFAYSLVFLALCSCKVISNLIDDDQVVAKVGDEKLYRSDVAAYIPDLVTGEDSIRMAEQFINSWAVEHLYLDMAERQLSEEEMDVTDELENYRRSLLKYRYEQHYVNERLDTLITPEQVSAFYDEHKADFVLQRPILKVRFVDVMKDSPNRDAIIKMMTSANIADLERADTLAASSALRYFDRSDTWMDAADLAREFGIDYLSMLSRMEGRYIKIENEGSGELKVAYVLDIIRDGVAPLDFCSESIREIILSGRKHNLLTGLEQDLLEDALERKTFVKYEQ